ncbi:MAG: hypothetical protein JNM39_09300 [Bdellovibrionaceae bacterium]|nr:hypothetical protein [Pseudobdellovibrionaceae bacterium]
MSASRGLKIFSQLIQMSTALFLIFVCLGCNEPQRSLGVKNKAPGKEPSKPQPIPPNYDPDQFSVNSVFTYRETVQALDDGKTWSEVQKHCYLWLTKEIRPNMIIFEIRKQIDCSGKFLEKEWRRTITFITLTGEVISDQIFNETETNPGELNHKSIAPIFFTNRKLGLDHQLLKEFKIGQTVYSAFKVKDTVYWNNPDSPFHSLRLYHVAPGAKDSNMRTIISLEAAYP